jgi:outer membrane lipoprotein-sorting protein
MKLLLLIIPFSLFAFVEKNFKAHFIQETKSLRSTIEEPVLVEYAYSGNIFFEITGDNPVTYVCNNDKVWIYFPPFKKDGKGEVKTGESSKFCYAKIFDALTRGLESNDYYSVNFKGKRAEVLFKDNIQEALGVSKVIVEFKSNASKKSLMSDMLSFEIFKQDNESPVLLKLKMFEKNYKTRKTPFEFDIPPKASVSKL